MSVIFVFCINFLLMFLILFSVNIKHNKHQTKNDHSIVKYLSIIQTIIIDV